MSFQPNLPAYFERIGLQGSPQPTASSLNEIVRRHVQTIPFENIDVLTDSGISLAPEDVENKLVHQRRGGYCFEQNSHLLHVLAAIGFEVRPLSARVRISRPRTQIPPRTHVFGGVNLEDERLLVDVGVGGLSPACALRLDDPAVQPTPHEPRRLVREGRWGDNDQRGPEALIYHQAQLDTEWVDVCDFTLEEMPAVDREIANWFTSKHPQSHFRDRLMAARATDGGRIGLLNRRLTIRDGDGHASKAAVESPDHLREVLKTHFGITLAKDVDLRCSELRWNEPVDLS